MGLRGLIFRDTFEVNADYKKIAIFFKTKLDKTYFKGTSIMTRRNCFTLQVCLNAP
jgi:hypothetical protein